MKLRIIVAFSLALALASIASVASAAPSPQRQIAALQKQARLQQRQINALTQSVSSLKSIVAESNVSALSSTVSSMQSDVSTLKTNLNTVALTLVCRTAQFQTNDMSFIDLFDLIAGQPEAFQGQTAPDNGACAQVGLTPPSPAADRELPATDTPFAFDMRQITHLLGIQTGK